MDKVKNLIKVEFYNKPMRFIRFKPLPYGRVGKRGGETSPGAWRRDKDGNMVPSPRQNPSYPADYFQYENFPGEYVEYLMEEKELSNTQEKPIKMSEEYTIFEFRCINNNFEDCIAVEDYLSEEAGKENSLFANIKELLEKEGVPVDLIDTIGSGYLFLIHWKDIEKAQSILLNSGVRI